MWTNPSSVMRLGEGSASNPDDDVLDVQAQLGKITDNQRFLTLWDDVVITRYDDVITMFAHELRRQ